MMNQPAQVRQKTTIPFREGIRPDLIGMINSSAIYKVTQDYWVHLVDPPDDMPTSFGTTWSKLRERQGKGEGTGDYHLPFAVVDRGHVMYVHEGRDVMDNYYPALKRTIEEYIAQIIAQIESTHAQS